MRSPKLVRIESPVTGLARVEFPDFGISRPLPEGEQVTIELTRDAGEYDFTCQMGMLRGKLVARVTPGARDVIIGERRVPPHELGRRSPCPSRS